MNNFEAALQDTLAQEPMRESEQIARYQERACWDRVVINDLSQAVELFEIAHCPTIIEMFNEALGTVFYPDVVNFLPEEGQVMKISRETKIPLTR